ncbi:hypothetical protein MVES_003249 [Malassezia vespertilionis]|uniref:Gamma-glutamyltransferase n=2 Tax=Malassezia vespertilionis TaxID=2020962 RepID=A0A2N1J8I8_9BASI|nr:hypothetical protein MVES_003249 [Malassezia vespertilionis]
MQAPSQGHAPAYPTTGNQSAVSCEVDMCSYAGMYLLEQGGSAADAAIGAALCVGVVDSFHSGIGGGGFALIKEPGQDPAVVDYREVAPQAAHRDMYKNKHVNASLFGGLAVAVPGEVRGYEAMHARYGKLPWSALFEPAITIARRGFLAPKQLALVVQFVGQPLCMLPWMQPHFCPNGQLLRTGEQVRFPALADTLARIAAHGPDTMYTGEFADRMVKSAAIAGGILTHDDLASYRAEFRNATYIDYQDQYRVWTVPAPASGVTLLSALRTMENYPSVPYSEHDALWTHRLIESAKFAYGEHSRYGDPAFVSGVRAMEAASISVAHGKARYHQINDTHVLPLDAYDPAHDDIQTSKGTSHLNAVDADGLAVSMTTTINTFWGSFVQTPDGITMNNGMNDFGVPGVPNNFGYVPSPANFIVGGKRPLSSMCPYMIQDGDALAVIGGSAGGSRIITANLQIAYAYLSSRGKVALQDAIARPRWHDQLLPPVTLFEQALPNFDIPFTDYDNRYAFPLLTSALSHS